MLLNIEASITPLQSKWLSRDMTRCWKLAALANPATVRWKVTSDLATSDVICPPFSSGLSGLSSMFGKKKKRLEISAPSNFEHRVHTGFDPREQKFTGLPQQWQSLLADTANRPKPMVDPSYITPIQLAPMKVGVEGAWIQPYIHISSSSEPAYSSSLTFFFPDSFLWFESLFFLKGYIFTRACLLHTTPSDTCSFVFSNTIWPTRTITSLLICHQIVTS